MAANLSISLSATNHLLNSWTLSIPLQETDTSSNLFTVCLKLCKFRGPWKRKNKSQYSNNEIDAADKIPKINQSKGAYNAVGEEESGSAGDGISGVEDDGVGVVTNGASEAVASPCFHGQMHRISYPRHIIRCRIWIKLQNLTVSISKKKKKKKNFFFFGFFKFLVLVRAPRALRAFVSFLLQLTSSMGAQDFSAD